MIFLEGNLRAFLLRAYRKDPNVIVKYSILDFWASIVYLWLTMILNFDCGLIFFLLLFFFFYIYINYINIYFLTGTITCKFRINIFEQN